LSERTLDGRFFRHEYGRLVARLARRMGMHHLELVEDAVQSALLSAVEVWTKESVPEDPSAWLWRVAYNNIVGELRRRANRGRLIEQQGQPSDDGLQDAPTAFLAGDVRDDLLRVLFACCDEAIPVDSQLVVALKTLSGFDVPEIAERLFTTEANVYKRLGRARARLRELGFELKDLASGQTLARLPAVQSILYLMFTEGYLSSDADQAIRRDLCDEARRLTAVLAHHPVTGTPPTFALLALMYLHAARMPARQDGSGGLLLLEEQDRTLWDRDEIGVGLSWLTRSAHGDVFSRFHAEAGIAAEHCLAPSFAETRWDRITDSYALLEQMAPSPLHTLNRALAMAEWKGPRAGLAVLEGHEPPSWLAGSYMWAAVLADLHRRCGHHDVARGYRDAALATAPSPAVREVLRRRLQEGAQ
jgi:RNA polymerase sigma-70 factor (ECF subfamily)